MRIDSSTVAQVLPIRVQVENDVWWLVDERAGRFVSLGINHLQPDCWLAPYNREATLARYGADLESPDGGFAPHSDALKRLVNSCLDKLDDWGFNTLGMHTHGVPTELFAESKYFLACLDAFHLGSRFRFGVDRFPDVFDAAFEHHVEAKAQRVCEKLRGSANLIGYVFSDIPRWYFYPGQHEWLSLPVHPWVDDLRSLGPDAPGKKVWMEVLAANHGSVARCAAAHGVPDRQWDDLAARTRWPAPSDPRCAQEDSQAMLARAAERWYDVHTRALRRHDPGRLIFGDKLHSPHTIPHWLLDTVRRHVDVLLIQWYKPFAEQRGALIELHRRLGKPILNGDSGFACLKPPHQTEVKGYRVADLVSVGRSYTEYLDGIMSLPFMIGWHHCGFMEQWDGGKRSEHGELSENGLMDPFERPHEPVVRAVRQANLRAAALHAESARRVGI